MHACHHRGRAARRCTRGMSMADSPRHAPGSPPTALGYTPTVLVPTVGTIAPFSYARLPLFCRSACFHWRSASSSRALNHTLFIVLTPLLRTFSCLPCIYNWALQHAPPPGRADTNRRLYYLPRSLLSLAPLPTPARAHTRLPFAPRCPSSWHLWRWAKMPAGGRAFTEASEQRSEQAPFRADVGAFGARPLFRPLAAGGRVAAGWPLFIY